MRKIVLTMCSAALMGTAPAATAAEGLFQIGPQVGYSKTTITASVLGVSESGSEKGPSIGLVARYTVPLDNGLLLGVHAGINREFITDEESESGVTQEVSTQWSLDLMPRIGYRTGKATLSIAAGFSALQGDLEFSALGVSIQDENWHMGWKVAPGIDYQLNESVTLFSQVHYAEYGSETYNIVGIPIDLEPKTYGIRAGFLYGF